MSNKPKFIAQADPTIIARHQCFLAATGMGKTHALNEWQLAAEQNVIGWDPAEQLEKGQRFHSLRDLSHAVVKARAENKTVRAFLVAPDPTPQLFQQFCTLIWLVRSASWKIRVPVDELADVMVVSGKAPREWGRLATQGRKYGIFIGPATQRPQEVDKTSVTQCDHRWIGFSADGRDQGILAGYAGVPIAEIQKLAPSETATQRTLRWLLRTPEAIAPHSATFKKPKSK